MRIGVYGSGSGFENSLVLKARDLGRQIAFYGDTLITGACGGLPYEAVKGSREDNGKSLGFSPASNLEQHIHHYKFPADAADEFIFTGQGLKGRNVLSVQSCNACIFIEGRIGTLNEFTIAYDEGKLIGVLTGTGGTADMIKYIVEKLQKPTKAKIIYASDPAKLIQKISEV